MAISPMAKFLIVTHKSETKALFEEIQEAGIAHVLSAEESMASKDWPDITYATDRPKKLEDQLNRTKKAISFLEGFEQAPKFGSMLAPRAVIDLQQYKQVVDDKSTIELLDESEQVQTRLDDLTSKADTLRAVLHRLKPWKELQSPVEELHALENVEVFVGQLSGQNYNETMAKLEQFNVIPTQVGVADNHHAVIVVCLKEYASDVQKTLRAGEFDPISFEGMRGTVAENIESTSNELAETETNIQKEKAKAGELSKKVLDLKILADHLLNLVTREQAESDGMATSRTILLEGWVKKRDFNKLEKIVSKFSATNVSTIEPGKDEPVPTEITNRNSIKPFEVITRLYGMPQRIDVDPTAFLAPFFAIFFALCLTDAAYGIILIAATVLALRKIQGDKKLVMLLAVCSGFTIVAGALTGGWFGNFIQLFIPALEPIRQSMVWFDPMEEPMTFLVLSVALGYFQIQVGFFIALGHNILRKEYFAAMADQMTWIVLLNSLLLFGMGRSGMLPEAVGTVFGYIAIIPAVVIFFFSERSGGLAARFGMGLFNLFSTIFFLGDVLSYLRLMALGMVTAGLAMAVNVIALQTKDIPYGIGYVVMALILIGGHMFNLAISALSAFVHTLRLQYVEFFPKFFQGGGKDFKPLTKEYKNIYIRNNQ